MKTTVLVAVSTVMAFAPFVSPAHNFPRGLSFAQVQMDVRIIEVDAVDAIAFSPPLTTEQFLDNLKTRKNTEVLSTQRLTVNNGDMASIRSVREYIFPTEYKIDFAATNAAPGSAQIVVVPCSFVMREVGVIVNFTPTISHVASTNIFALTNDGSMFRLPPEFANFDSGIMLESDIFISIVGEPTWDEYAFTVSDDFGAKHHYAVTQPNFHVREINTKIILLNGSPTVIGGLTKEVVETKDTRIPVLWRISKIFGEKKETIKKRELYIVLTAKISQFPED